MEREQRSGLIAARSCTGNGFPLQPDTLAEPPTPMTVFSSSTPGTSGRKAATSEPDEKYGYAWLNATAMALDPSQAELGPENLAVSYPAPPTFKLIDFPPLPAVPRLVISVLFYHREDIIRPFLESLLPQIKEATANGAVSVDLYLVFNYEPPAALPAEIRRLIAALYLGQRLSLLNREWLQCRLWRRT